MPRAAPLDWLLLVLLGLIWGGSFLGIALALTGFAPLTIAAARIAIGAVILLALSFALGHGLPPTGTRRCRRIWLHALGMGMLSNALPFSLLAWGQRHVTSGFAGITMAVVPLLVLPLAHLFVPGERMTRRKTLGFVVGFAGVVVLIGPASLMSGGESLARLACVAASCSYACGAIVTRLAPPGPPLAFAAAGLLLATVVIVPLALAVAGLPAAPPPAALAGVLYLGLLPTALATVLLVFIIRRVGPSFLSLVNYQVPVWAVVIGMAVLGEQLPPQFLGALVLILAGLAIAELRIGRARPPATPAGASDKLSRAGCGLDRAARQVRPEGTRECAAPGQRFNSDRLRHHRMGVCVHNVNTANKAFGNRSLVGRVL